jgi:solute carrier family 45 protein 1/2/4
MASFSQLPMSEDEDLGSSLRGMGVSKVLGPAALKLPLLTIGMLGLQIIWSVEMSYGM